MTSELGSMWYERKMEDFVRQNVRAQEATTQRRAGKIFCVGDTSFENYCMIWPKIHTIPNHSFSGFASMPQRIVENEQNDMALLKSR